MATRQDSFWLAPEQGERPRTWMWGGDGEHQPRTRRALRLPRLTPSAPTLPSVRLPSIAPPHRARAHVVLPQVSWRSPTARAGFLIAAALLLVLLFVAGPSPLLLLAPLAGSGGGVGMKVLLAARARGEAQAGELDAAALAEIADSFQASNWKERIGLS